MSRAYGSRPSELLGIDNEVRAYQVDNAVFLFGTALANELESVEGKNGKEIEKKQQRILNKWLDLPQQYRDPGKEVT